MNGDPLRFFRIEARDLVEGLSQGMMAMERGADTSTEIAKLFRFAHTLKGAARIVGRSTIAECANLMEDALAAHRDAKTIPSSQEVTDFLRLIDTISNELGMIESPQQTGANAGEQLDTVRVDLATMEAFADAMFESEVHLGGIRASVASLDRALRLCVQLRQSCEGSDAQTAHELRAALVDARQAIAASVDATELPMKEARAQADLMRMVPAGSVFASLERAVRDAALQTSRQATFHGTGGEVRLDTHILAVVKDALVHVVRNAVARGIEPADLRQANGKPSAGKIELRVERRGDQVVFCCSDDGKGIDASAVRAAAVRRNMVSAAEAETLTNAQAIQLVLRAGLTTATEVTELSGRGVGLDVVQAAASRCKGDVTVQSDPRGTTIELSVRVSMSTLTALAAHVGDQTVLIPLDAVVTTLRMPADKLVRQPHGWAVVVDDQPVAFFPLANVLGREGSEGRGVWSVVVVRHQAERVALGADTLMGTREVALRPLPSAMGRCGLVAGACFDSDGVPLLVLDPAGLPGAGRGAHLSTRPLPREHTFEPILVVDDSLTTRMLEQSILESAGYRVELASSAEEALQKAKSRRFGLFVVDVEMPGMNGFEFVSSVRASATLREIPAMIVSSLGGQSDRRKGKEVGADAYVVKSQFDQAQFLKQVGELLAREK